MASLLGLPPVTSELKPILPYLQRAEELKKQDPVIAYWCAYYAAQVGITLKARDTQSKDVLFGLLGILETMKHAIGPNEAVDIELVSAVYVENFALNVFANADNEDRSGRATKSTAKKFLAAANFLEVLKTFPKTELSESVEDKIRYSKWKAAEIAKAFREGRKLVPGPPGWAEDQEELSRLRLEQEEQNRIASALAGSLPNASDAMPISGSPTTHSFPSPPNSFSHSSFGGHSSSPPRPNQAWAQNGDGPSETWSTIATPGASDPPPSSFTVGIPSPRSAGLGWEAVPGAQPQQPSPSQSPTTRTKARSGSESSTGTVGSSAGRGILKQSPPPARGTSVGASPGSSPKSSKSRSKSRSPDSEKKVHFSPSTASISPTRSSPPKEYQGPSSIYSGPPQITSSPVISPKLPSANWGAPPSSPSRAYQVHAQPPPPPSLPASLDFELTPAIITKAQKHCRFAISSLDYEDAQQAKKELRAALALLGG